MGLLWLADSLSASPRTTPLPVQLADGIRVLDIPALRSRTGHRCRYHGQVPRNARPFSLF